nr:MAG TPA: hypothetical protein [Caudoviricetes sp.]
MRRGKKSFKSKGTVSRIAQRVKQDLACMLKQEGVETW